MCVLIMNTSWQQHLLWQSLRFFSLWAESSRKRSSHTAAVYVNQGKLIPWNHICMNVRKSLPIHLCLHNLEYRNCWGALSSSTRCEGARRQRRTKPQSVPKSSEQSHYCHYSNPLLPQECESLHQWQQPECEVQLSSLSVILKECRCLLSEVSHIFG